LARKAVDQSPRKREWCPSNTTQSVESFIAHPASAKAPVMVVIHEILA